ncbi:response regulator transcription factor [Stenotrophomonas sp. Sa5BUN4]|uniref:Response regulator transcription factor n=1 Tax=Stenotrophomonas lacuserhaii TaxID=2760084 RepID=A0A8X8G0H7_9GAMM|nr:response regulator transcription factor [Stenotrophomonas pennii]MBD7954305.1 response regulator transcription factor [Stenotrophomonas pennii]
MAFRHDIYTADDHEAVRGGVAAALASSEFVVTGEGATSDEVLALLATAVPDALVTDFAMPGVRFEDGLDYLEYVTTTYPTLPVVVLTMIRRPVVLQAMRDCGVRALVDKSEPLRVLPGALRRAVAGDTFISETFASLVDTLHVRVPKGAIIKSAKLSPSERAVLKLLGEGRNLREVADALERSFSTVSTLKQRAMAKVGLTNNSDLHDYIRHLDDTAGDA